MDTKKTLEQAKSELRDLLKKRDEIDRRLKGLVQVIDGLGTLGEKPQENDELAPIIAALSAGLQASSGFTDTVRAIINHSSGPITPVEIRDELVAAGFEGKSLKGILINVYTVISRLKKNDEIVEVSKGGKPAYQRNIQRVIYENLFNTMSGKRGF